MADDIRVAPSSEPSIPADALDLLALRLYGRRAKPREFIGGSNAIILRDAEGALGRAEDRIAELGETVARRESMLDRLSESNDNQLRRIAELELALNMVGTVWRNKVGEWIVSQPEFRAALAKTGSRK